MKRAAEVVAVESLLAVARLMPRRLGQWVFAEIGALAARIFPKDRRRAIDNLGVAFPDTPEPIRRALATASFKALGRNIYEFLRLAGASPEALGKRVARIEGMENFLEAHREGNGVIVMTGHIGCWELMPAHFVGIGFPVSVIARRMKVPRLNDRLVEIRKSVGVVTIDRDDNPRRMFEPLRRGEILGVLIDQHTHVAGIWVPFFNRAAYTPTAVAKIALAAKSPIVPMAVYLERDGRHVIRVLPAIRPRDGMGRDESVREITAECSLAVERLIRFGPKQWVWFHHRWREPEKREAGVEAAYAAEA
jgi:Kdo2-lipid IVA lauroyltransferase/acyltransferase